MPKHRFKSHYNKQFKIKRAIVLTNINVLTVLYQTRYFMKFMTATPLNSTDQNRFSPHLPALCVCDCHSLVVADVPTSKTEDKTEVNIQHDSIWQQSTGGSCSVHFLQQHTICFGKN